MAQFSGEERFSAPPAELYPKFADAGYLARCLPDAEVLEATPDRAVWKQKPKLAFVAGVIETTLSVAARTPGEAVRYTVLGKGVGATSTVETELRLAPADGGGTLVRWSGDVTALTGLLKMVPKPLIQAAAKAVIAEVWAAVGAKVGGGRQP